MAWSLHDTAQVIEAEERLKTLADVSENDDLYHRLMERVTGDPEQARLALYHRIRERKWRQTEPR